MQVSWDEWLIKRKARLCRMEIELIRLRTKQAKRDKKIRKLEKQILDMAKDAHIMTGVNLRG